MEICNTAVVCGNTAVGESGAGMAAEEFAAVMGRVERTVVGKGTIAGMEVPIVEMAVVEPIMKVSMMVVKDAE